MIIPLRVHKIRGRLAELRILASCVVPKSRTGLMPIEFVFDTGSSRSFISYKDALRFNLPINSFRLLEYGYIAGSTYGFHEFMHGVRFAFKDERGELARLSMSSFCVVKPTKIRPGARTDAERLPSILGLDFLVQNGLSFHFDPGSETAWFEKK